MIRPVIKSVLVVKGNGRTGNMRAPRKQKQQKDEGGTEDGRMENKWRIKNWKLESRGEISSTEIVAGPRVTLREQF